MTSVAIDLAGEWIGYYSGHFDEVIRLTQDGDYVEARKITGDDFVPAGELTWQADLCTGEAQRQFAEREFRNARLVPGKLVVLSPERIVFCWTGYGQGEYDAAIEGLHRHYKRCVAMLVQRVRSSRSPSH